MADHWCHLFLRCSTRTLIAAPTITPRLLPNLKEFKSPAMFNGNSEPSTAGAAIDVLLAQAQSLERLRRHEDCKRKRMVAMGFATDWVEAHPKSGLAWLNGARVAIAGGKFELAATMLSSAR